MTAGNCTRLSSSLHERMTDQPETMATIKVYVTSWCPDCRKAIKFLNERGIAHEEIDVDESDEAEALVLKVNDGRRKVPTFELDGRYFSCSPYSRESLAAGLKELQQN